MIRVTSLFLILLITPLYLVKDIQTTNEAINHIWYVILLYEVGISSIYSLYLNK